MLVPDIIAKQSYLAALAENDDRLGDNYFEFAEGNITEAEYDENLRKISNRRRKILKFALGRALEKGKYFPGMRFYGEYAAVSDPNLPEDGILMEEDE